MLMMKAQEDDVEFLYVLNGLLSELAVDEIDLSDLTIIDKYIIYHYIRVLYLGTTINLNVTCSSCEKEFPTIIDLNTIMENNASILDKNYSKTIKFNDSTQVECTIPTLKNEYEIAMHLKNSDPKDVGKYVAYNSIAYIKNLFLKGVKINISGLDLNDAIRIFDNLPSSIFVTIKNEFIDPITKTVVPQLMEFTCPTEGCKSLKFDLNLGEINDTIKLLFKKSPVTTFFENFYLCKGSGISMDYIMNLSPVERDLLLEFHTEDIKHAEAASNSKTPASHINVSDLGFEDFE